MFPFYQFIKKHTITAAFILLSVGPVLVTAQERITTIEVSEPHNNKIALRSEDLKMKLGSSTNRMCCLEQTFTDQEDFTSHSASRLVKQ